jgi:hypothetical protein
MPALRPLVTLLIAAAALPLAGCGSGDEGLLSSRQASRLSDALEDARRAVDDGRCGAAREAAQRGSDGAASLPERVDTELQRNLQDGFNHLVDRINAECAEEEPEPEPTPDETETPEPTPTPTPTPTETPEPTPTPTVTPDPTPTVEPDTGGTPGEEPSDEPVRGINDDLEGGG